MILAIETSTTHASLALVDATSGDVIDSRDFVTDRAHNTAIFKALGSIIEGRREEIETVAVGIGPGSYSGIRVGIAVANGLNIALGIPTVGFSSLEAWEGESDSYVVAGDARRRSFFIAEVVERKLVAAPDLIDSGSADDALEPFRERGLKIVTPDATVAEAISDACLSFPHAGEIARLAVERPVGEEAISKPLEPHYLRAPYITTPKKKARR